MEVKYPQYPVSQNDNSEMAFFWDALYTWHTKSPAAGGSPKISLKTRASAHFRPPIGPIIVFAVVFFTKLSVLFGKAGIGNHVLRYKAFSLGHER